MKFGSVPLHEARGCVLAHSIRLPDGTLRKGLLLDGVVLQRLASAGVDSVVVARLEPDDIGEDEAAAQIAQAIGGVAIRVGHAATGRANLHAQAPGLLRIDAARIHAANLVHEGLTIATLLDDSIVSADQMLATVKIIPYAVPASALQQVLSRLGGASPAMRVATWRAVRVALVMTRLPGTTPAVLGKMRHAVAHRLAPLQGLVVAERVADHEENAVAGAVAELAVATESPDVILISGIAATVDRQDVVPAAVVRAGGRVLHAGMPVDPGNLLVLAQLAGGLPVVGIPTCARSPKLNGFDFVLRRLAAGEQIAGSDIQAMGVGGLLTEIRSRPMPRDAGDEAGQG